jgi:hypothetical protein
MGKKLIAKLRESAQSVLPVSLLVLLLHFTISPLPPGTLALFLCGTLLLIVGMSIFQLGADLAMMPIGEAIGFELTKSRKLGLIIAAGFVLGVAVTIAEPDLQVLTKQVPAVPDLALVAAVAAGVGAFFVIALLRMLFHVPISILFIVSYGLVFLAAALFSPDFLAVAFDSGGVTTGPITVPFILALGAGIATVRGGSSSEEDSFGVCALCSIGPVFAVLALGLVFDAKGSGFAFDPPTTVSSLTELPGLFARGFGQFFVEVLTVLLPIVLIFGLFQVVRLRLGRTAFIRIGVGILYTLVGLSVFLTGVNLGFMPAGQMLGAALAAPELRWALLPLSAALGLLVVFAEPAVHLLTRQIEDITSGAVSRRLMMTGLSIAVGLALVLSVVRVLTGASVWWFLAPGYLIALAMTPFTPKLFTAIAFDAGGVASGTMTAAFLLPFAVGICKTVGGDIMTDAFGIIAMVAMMPLITLQIMGMIYGRKLRRAQVLDTAAEALAAEEPVVGEDLPEPPAAVAATLPAEPQPEPAAEPQEEPEPPPQEPLSPADTSPQDEEAPPEGPQAPPDKDCGATEGNGEEDP